MGFLSVKSIFLAYALLHLLFGVLTNVFYKKTDDKSLRFISYTCFTYFFLYGLLTFRSEIPTTIGLILPNFLSIFALLMFSKALFIANEKSYQPKFDLYIFIFAILYACLFPLIIETDLKKLIPLIVGIVLGFGHLFIAHIIRINNHSSTDFFIPKILFTTYLVAAFWLMRGLFSSLFEFNLATDQNLINAIFNLVIHLLIFTNIIFFNGMRLDKSIHYKNALERLNMSLFEVIKEKNEIQVVSQSLESGMINVLNQLSKERDNETGNHIIRTQYFVRLLAKRLADLGKIEGDHTEDWSRILFQAAPLHDIGKVGIPDSVLLKTGRLDSQEWDVMKTHTLIGERILISMNIDGQINSDIIKVAIEIAGAHHENWDGSGYPRSLKGKNIPQSARIMALADVYDALLSNRPYKKAWSYKDTIDYIVSLKGSKFDPDIVDAFLDLKAEFRLIRRQFRDD